MTKIKVTLGDILRLEFLEPLNISPYKLAKDLGVSQPMIGKILKGKSRLTVDMAYRLSLYFGTTIELWLNLQNLDDIENQKEMMKENDYNIKLCPALAS